MSNRDSLGFGELLPQDVIDIFAQDKHSKRGRKKRTRSLGRAFGLFKRKKKKKNHASNGQSHGLGPALDLALDGHRTLHQGGHKGGQKSGRHLQGNSHVLPRLNDDDKTSSPPKIQENVFIESNRSKYVEDLHTEAQEGLKMIQQEESNIGVEYRDNESTVSTTTVQTDGESTGFVTDSTIPDTSSVVSMQSSVSTRSSRHGLTRQGSTFRPLDSGKKSEKTRTRRKHMKAATGIPRHVRRELGLDREGWALPHVLNEEQLYNGEAGLSPTTDGPQHVADSPKESGAGLKTSNIIHPLSKDKVALLNAAHAGHRDDLALLHRLNPLLAGEDRPRSLAVPWMTTASSLQQQPPSPVMTMSPQAAYMSKIIPNAVLPPSIDVVEISRSSRRSSVRTISKSNLISSPSPSRASSRASSTRTWSSNITSASRYNAPNQSDSSCWSNSESSETLVSESSTISSSSTPKQTSQRGCISAKAYKVNVNASNLSSKDINKGDQLRKDGQFVRSLSVMKPKRVPLPPNRSISLHGKKRQLEVSVTAGKYSPSAQSKEKENIQPGSPVVPSGTLDSPGYHGDTSSLDDSTGSSSFTLIKSQLQEPKTEDSKKDAEMVHKEASHEKQESLEENKLNKVISPSSGYSSQDGTSPHFSKQSHSPSPKNKGFLAKIQLFFSGSTSTGLAPTLSAQPQVAKNSKSTGDPKHDTGSISPSVQTLRELFNIPPPPNIHAPPPPPPEVWSQNNRSIELLLGPPAPGHTYIVIKKNPKDRRQQRQSPSVSTEGSVKSLVVERKHRNPAAESVNGSQGSVHVPDAKTVQESECLYAKVDKNNKERLALNGDLKEIGKDEKVRVCEMLNGILVKAVDKQGAMREAEGQNVSFKATETKPNLDTLQTISSVHISPLINHHIQSTVREAAKVTSVPLVPVASPESSWPPPPPPMSQVGKSVEMDFPLPPPPMFGEGGLVLSPKVEVEKLSVTTRGGPQKLCSSQEVVHQSLSIPPPPPYTAPPPPTITKVLLPQNEVSPPLHPVTSKESATLVVQDVVPPVTLLSSLLVKEAPPPVNVVEVSVLPSKEISAQHFEDFSPPLPQGASQSIREAAPERNFTPPQSIPPPLPSQLQPLKQESISLEPKTKDLSKSIFIPPNSIPPPPPIVPLLKSSVVIQATDDDSGTDDVPPSPPFEFKNTPLLKEAEEPTPSPPLSIPLPPPLPVQVPASIKHQSSPLSTENQNQEKTSEPAVHKEPTPMITPSLLQMVKLRSVNNSPEPSEVLEQVSASDVHEKPTSTVTPSLLQMVKLRSINNSPEPAKDLKEEATSSGSSPVLQMVKLRSINNSPEPAIDLKEEATSSGSSPVLQMVKLRSINNSPEPAIDLKEEATSSGSSPVLQMVKLRSINDSPEPSDTGKGVKEEAESTSSFSDLQVVKLQSANSNSEPSEAAKGAKEEVSTGTPDLQMIKLPSINNNPEPSEAQDRPEPEVKVNQQQPDKQVPTSSNNEAPQKPIRKSLIMLSPTSTTPPVIITSEPTLPKSKSIVVPPTSTAVVSSVKKSPTTTTSVSMNLQEAIRLRTAARTKEGPASRLSLHSPLSPPDFLKSPTSTASFIFSKSNTRVATETKLKQEDKEIVQKKMENPSVTKVTSEAESKMGGKVPPPVAKKPNPKSKEAEASEAVEQTAGQEAQQDGTKDGTEKINGTAGTVQEETSSA